MSQMSAQLSSPNLPSSSLRFKPLWIWLYIMPYQVLAKASWSLFCMVEICWPVCLINGATRSCQDDLLPFASDLCIHVNVSLSTSLLNVSRQRMRNQHESARSQQQANTFLYNCRLHSSGLISLMSCLTLTPKRHLCPKQRTDIAKVYPPAT